MKCSRCGSEQSMDLCDPCYRFEKDGVSTHDIERLIRLANSYGLELRVTRDEYKFSRPGKATGANMDTFDEAKALIDGYALHTME